MKATTTYTKNLTVPVVLLEIAPETFVGPALNAAPGTTTTPARSKSKSQGRSRLLR